MTDAGGDAWMPADEGEFLDEVERRATNMGDEAEEIVVPTAVLWRLLEIVRREQG